MKSHIKPSGESVCTGGNKNEARPTGNTDFYLIPLPSFPLLSLSLSITPTRNFLSFLSLITYSIHFVLAIFITLIPVFQLFTVTVLLFSTSFGVFGDLKMAHVAAFRF